MKDTLEREVYEILKKHRLSLKKREEVIVDLLDFINEREKAINFTDSSLHVKDKNTITFEEYLILNNFKKDIVQGFYIKGEYTYTYKQVIAEYKESQL